MNNYFQLTASLYQVGTLRYTPAGIPVLDITLQHESYQNENGVDCLVKFKLPAKIIGKQAQAWQNRQGDMVEITGFIAQSGLKTNRPILRIQTITKYKRLNDNGSSNI